MRIQVICIGKLKEKYWTDAIAEYSKRLSRYCTLEIVELKEARLPDKASAAECEHCSQKKRNIFCERFFQFRNILSSLFFLFLSYRISFCFR